MRSQFTFVVRAVPIVEIDLTTIMFLSQIQTMRAKDLDMLHFQSCEYLYSLVSIEWNSMRLSDPQTQKKATKVVHIIVLWGSQVCRES